MSQAVKQYMADYGVDDLRNTPLASDNYEGSWYDDGNYIPANGEIESIRDFVTKYLKVVKECNPSNEDDNNCFAPVYRLWDNSIPDDRDRDNFTTLKVWPGYRDYVLADGSVIRIGYWGDKEYPGPIELYVDVNGKKGPNRNGYDLWSMSIFYDGVIDEGTLTPECRKEGDCIVIGDTPSEIIETKFEYICKSWYFGGCFGHFLENGFKFDY